MERPGEPAESPGRLRVSFVTPFHLPRVSGMTELVRRLSTSLAASGHDVEVLTTNALRLPRSGPPGIAGPPAEVIDDVTIRRFGLAPSAHDVYASTLAVRHRVEARVPGIASTKGLARPLDQGPISAGLAGAALRATVERDVVVGVAFPYLTTVGLRPLPGSRAALIGVPLLHPRSGTRYTRGGLRALGRYDTLVGMTPTELAELERRGVVVRRPVVLSPGCDSSAYPQIAPAEARRRLGLPERPTVGYVGRLVQYKGLDTLLAAWPDVIARRPETNLIVAGAREPWPGLERLLADAAQRSGDRLSFHPDFSDEERAILLAACDVVVVPSREESFGMVAIEAFAASRPVIAGDIPAVRHVVRPGVDGYLVPVGDPAALADRVVSLLDDPAQMRRLGAEGRRRAVHEFDWSTITRAWEQIVLDAVSDGRSRSRPPG